MQCDAIWSSGRQSFFSCASVLNALNFICVAAKAAICLADVFCKSVYYGHLFDCEQKMSRK